MNTVSRIIDDLQNYGGLKVADIANVVSVSPTTLSGWMSGKESPHPKTQLIMSDLRYVIDRLSEFYTRDEIRTWLYSKHSLLSGNRAVDLINQDNTDQILAIIDGLDEGIVT